MNESLKSRAAAIRDYLDKVEPAIDPTLIYRYSVTAARQEALRLLIDRGNAAPADDRRLNDLSDILRALTRQIGLSTCTEDDKGTDGIPGITGAGGWLPGDPSRIVCGDWREAAGGW